MSGQTIKSPAKTVLAVAFQFNILFLIRVFVIISAIVSLSGVQTYSQSNGKISGNVRDQKTGEALVGVNIIVEGTSLGAVTDPEGDYFVINLAPGVYRVTASMIGYSKVTKTDIRVRSNQTTKVDFQLGEVSVQMGDVVIRAERPKVELDLTGSKATISPEDLANTWAKSLQEIVSDASGANINGGIRGSFGGDVSYRLDGLDMRDGGSNSNFSSVNMSTIQEVEVLKGGWNAEYGQANGAIINVVTRKASDRIHAIGTYKSRPAGQYHWGRNIYDKNDVFHTVMTQRDFWDTSKTWRTQWMSASDPGQKGNSVPKQFVDAFIKAYGTVPDTAQAMAEWWNKFVNDNGRFPQFDYTNRSEWESEITLYGPVIPGLSFLLSSRYKEGVLLYPSAYKYNPDMTFQGGLEWTGFNNSIISLNGMYTKFVNSGDPRTNYQSTETNVSDIASQGLPYITDPYDKFKYMMSGPSNNGSSAGNAGNTTIRPPEHAEAMNIQAKLKHVFSPTTFLEVALQYNRVDYNLDFRDIAQTSNSFPYIIKGGAYNGGDTTVYFTYKGLPRPVDSVEMYGIKLPSFGQPATSNLFGTERWAFPGDVWRSESKTNTYTIKSDLTSQVMKNHLVKTGLIFTFNNMSQFTHEGNNLSGQTPYIQVNDIVPMRNRPYEGAFYLQDKIEVGGMVLNAGFRVDMFNANKNVSSNFFDPLMISQYTPGNSGSTGLVGYRADGTGEAYSKTPTQIAFSPRIGISHPITETTVLHFMYGVFNQRPAWAKILGSPVVWTDNRATGNLDDVIRNGLLNSDFNVPDTLLVTYRYYGSKTGNPALTFEKMTQFEVGLEQNIADLFSLDVTMYYKEGENLTSLGINRGPDMSVVTSSGAGVETRLYGEPTTFANSDNRVPGQYIGNFTTAVNGAWANVRGIEATLNSRFRSINFELDYALSYLTTGRYYNSKIYTVSVLTGKPVAENTFAGPNNSDGGGIGTDDALWNPHNSAQLKISVVAPDDFGPEYMGVFPFADWVLSTSTRWVQGQEYTWYPTDYVGIEYPNNRRWEDRWNTNLNISRSFMVYNSLRIKLFAQVTNLFNQKHLRRFTGTDLTQYLSYGTMPYQATTKEPTEWDWYTNYQRQVYIGTTVEF